jgi:hypothetical protein
MLVASNVGTAHAKSYEFELVNLTIGTSTSIHRAVAPRSTSHFTVGSPSTCTFDLEVRFSDGYVHTVANVNICDTPHLVVSRPTQRGSRHPGALWVSGRDRVGASFLLHGVVTPKPRH